MKSYSPLAFLWQRRFKRQLAAVDVGTSCSTTGLLGGVQNTSLQDCWCLQEATTWRFWMVCLTAKESTRPRRTTQWLSLFQVCHDCPWINSLAQLPSVSCGFGILLAYVANILASSVVIAVHRIPTQALSFGFSKGISRPLLICGALDDAKTLPAPVRCGNHYITAESARVRCWDGG